MSGFMFEGITDNEEEEDRFINRECYVFNKKMMNTLDDLKCIHCCHYLTLECKYISEFVDEDGDA